jgi:hypothetical protein
MTEAAAFRIVPSNRFQRLARKLALRYPEFADLYDEARAILSIDPHNTSRAYPIKKLVDLKDAQYRLRLRRFRFRYDIEGKTVYLKRCAIRAGGTYRR